MNDVKRMVVDRFKDMKNPVDDWPHHVEFYIKGPLALKQKEEKKDEWNIGDAMDPDKVLGKTIKVENMLTTREKLNIVNGSTIEIYGEIKCRSDMPQK